MTFDRNAWQKEHRKKTKNKDTKAYEKTKAGFLMRTYRNMLSRVTGVQSKKAHLYGDLAILPKQSFYVWSLSDPIFNLLFCAWEEVGYSQKYSPSIDRIDSTEGYIEGNIQWITHSENSRKGAISKWQNQLP